MRFPRNVVLSLFILSLAAPTVFGAERIPITNDNSDQLVGWWEGKWAGSGFSGDMEVYIESVTKTGKVTASRMYTNTSLDSVGQIRDGELELDVEKGENDKIVLELYKDRQGNLYMEGRYRTHLGDKRYKGRIRDLKKANY